MKRGCAVALTDAGKGMGLYDPTNDTVHKVDGTRATRTVAGALSNFAVSNGGAAVLRAAEQDTAGLIDGVVAGEPSAQPNSLDRYGGRCAA